MLSIEDRIKYHLEDFSKGKLASAELANIFKAQFVGFEEISLKELAKLITSIKKPKPEKPKDYYSVVVGCTHLPFQNKKQWDATAHLINWLSARKTTDLVLDGDILDMNNISRHNKGNVSKITGLNLGDEYRLANLELSKIYFEGLRNKTYLYGNHEAWYFVHMALVDNAKLGYDVIKSPKEALKLEDRGFTVLEDYGQDKHHIGDLLVVHGHLVNKHSAMAHLDAYKQNVLFFHTHRMQTFTDSGPNGTQITAYNAGFGGDRTQPAFNYMDEGSKAKWQNGIAITYTDGEGHTSVELLRWEKERFIFMGHEFTADGVRYLLD